MCALSFGRALVLSRPKKPPRGFFPRSFMPTAPAAAGLWQRARSAAAAWCHPPPSRSTSALVRLSARAAQALVPRALACRSLARFSAPFGSVGPGRSALRLALAAPFPSFCAAPSVAPRGSPRHQPFLPLPLLGGGLSRSPLRGLPLGWVRSAPPAVLFRRAVGGAVSSFPVGVRCAFLSLRCGAGVTTPRPPKGGCRALALLPLVSVSFRHIVNYRHGVGGLGVFPQSPQQLFKALVFLCCAQH